LAAKIFWTVLVLVETFLLCWAVWWSFNLLLDAIKQVR
jgi:hypothetical protein